MTSSSSDDDSADIAAALELELEDGSSDPEQGNDNGDGGASKRRRVDGKATAAAAATTTTTSTSNAATDNAPRPPAVAPAAAAASACAHPATMGGICVVCGIHVSPGMESHETEAEERQRRRQEKQERQQERQAAAAAAAAAAGAAGRGATMPPPALPTAAASAAINHGQQQQRQPETDQVALRYIHAGLRVSAAEAARLREASDAASRAARRLHLVLDLDHTLLNSTRLEEIPRDSCGAAMDALIAAEDAEAARGRDGGGAGAAGGAAAAAAPAADGSSAPFPFQSLPEFPPHPSRSLFYLPAINLWTKLRPGTRAFLRKCSERYELAVYTHGDRAYAAAMAALLDPTGELLGGRVISQGDSTRAHHKSLDVVLGSDLTTVVLDDTRAVWPQHEGNLLLVDRYIFFPACAGRFYSAPAPPPPPPPGGGGGGGGGGEAGGAAAEQLQQQQQQQRQLSWLEKSQDEDLGTGMLSVAARVLDSVHESYFRELDEEEAREKRRNGGSGSGGNGDAGGETAAPRAAAAAKKTADIREHLHALRSSVLRGCVLVLSGLAPLGTPLDAVPAARTARALGAVVEERLAPGRTTHVVAAVDGTAKVRGARAHNASSAAAAAAGAASSAASRIHCVSPEWLSACLFGWERKDEELFPVAAAPASAAATGAAAMVARPRTDAEDLAAAAAAAGRAGG